MPETRYCAPQAQVKVCSSAAPAALRPKMPMPLARSRRPAAAIATASTATTASSPARRAPSGEIDRAIPAPSGGVGAAGGTLPLELRSLRDEALEPRDAVRERLDRGILCGVRAFGEHERARR